MSRFAQRIVTARNRLRELPRSQKRGRRRALLTNATPEHVSGDGSSQTPGSSTQITPITAPSRSYSGTTSQWWFHARGPLPVVLRAVFHLRIADACAGASLFGSRKTARNLERRVAKLSQWLERGLRENDRICLLPNLQLRATAAFPSPSPAARSRPSRSRAPPGSRVRTVCRITSVDEAAVSVDETSSNCCRLARGVPSAPLAAQSRSRSRHGPRVQKERPAQRMSAEVRGAAHPPKESRASGPPNLRAEQTARPRHAPRIGVGRRLDLRERSDSLCPLAPVERTVRKFL